MPRKETLVEHGFRMPSALDNRPLKFEEFEGYCKKVLFVSATPGEYELEKSQGVVVEQIIRPTGLIDPEIEIRPVGGQVDDLLERIRERVAAGERVLVTTLTKRMAEDLTEYYTELGVRVRYLHSDVDTLERIEILRDLRRGEFDVLVGINLLREGLDLPEVSLVAILDADKEGFLRSHRSLIQTTGRAARNLHGKVIMYADRMTAAMKVAIGETDRRRTIQRAYNVEHDITPATVTKAILDMSPTSGSRDYFSVPKQKIGSFDDLLKPTNEVDLNETIEAIRQEMFVAAEALDFEKAAKLRDQLKRLRGDATAAEVIGAAPARAKAGIRSNGGKRRHGRSLFGKTPAAARLKHAIDRASRPFRTLAAGRLEGDPGADAMTAPFRHELVRAGASITLAGLVACAGAEPKSPVATASPTATSVAIDALPISPVMPACAPLHPSVPNVVPAAKIDPPVPSIESPEALDGFYRALGRARARSFEGSRADRRLR